LKERVLIRKAALEDVGTILALLKDDDLGKLSESDDCKIYEGAFHAISNDPNQILAVAILDANVVGCLQITFIPGLSRRGMWRGQIEAVRVARSLRGNGVGTLLLEWAKDTCRDRGCGMMQLLADGSRVDAHRFYESLGFKGSHLGFRLHF
jgi:GNAT superfamily N-acetyltransferase